MGIKKKNDLFWIVNNDCVVEPECLSELVNAYRQKGEGIFGGVSLNNDNETINFSGGFELDDTRDVVFARHNTLKGGNKKLLLQKQEISEMAYVNGACIMIPYKTIIKHGFIDQSFFLYGEELDYCFKLRKTEGIKSFIVSTALVKHEGSTSLSKNEKLKRVKTYYLTRNYSYFQYNYQLKTKKEIISSSNATLGGIVKTFFLKFTKDKNYFLESGSAAASLGLCDFIVGVKGKVFEPNDYI